ncbi:MAG: arylsulfatase [Bacteroidota bacterium]
MNLRIYRNITGFVLSVILSLVVGGCDRSNSQPTNTVAVTKPNIVIFYVDDLGYADVSCYGAKGVVTPNVDQLASEGIMFTDAHSPAATCTPSRYSLLTGEYAFRNNAAILPGDAPLLIDTSKLTIPKMLKKAGYTSAVVGKWHLGLGLGDVDWNAEVSPGPLEVGFDYSFLLPATGDRVPTVYLEGHEVVGLSSDDPIEVSYKEKVGNRPTGIENPELLRYKADVQHSETIVNGVSRIGSMAGGDSALWVDEEFPDIFTQKAVDFINKSKDDPFFLFFSFHDIHVPRLPNERFSGKSSMGPRGDAIVQMDWMTGRIMEELKTLGLEENTLIIFTSDNGPVLNDGYEDFAVEMIGDHNPSGPFRGGKYSAFEAGTRVPTIAYWPNTIEAKKSNALFTQVDLLASLAKLTGVKTNNNDAIDSQDQLNALLGLDDKGREYLLEESFTMSIRTDKWKYINPISTKGIFPNWLKDKKIEGGFESTPQLYNMKMDRGEQINVAEDNPKVVKELHKELEKIIKLK